MRVDVVDPSALTPPYDHALCAALAHAGAEVRLQTSRFGYGPVPAADGYDRVERFYRRLPAVGRASARARFAAKLAQHVPDMLAYRRAAAAADVVHFQWLTVQPVDVHLLPRGRPIRPLVLTELRGEPCAGAHATDAAGRGKAAVAALDALVSVRRRDRPGAEAARLQPHVGARAGQRRAQRVGVGGREGRGIDDVHAHATSLDGRCGLDG